VAFGEQKNIINHCVEFVCVFFTVGFCNVKHNFMHNQFESGIFS
jgi:hypothetical protein